MHDVAVIGMGGAGQMAVLRAALNHLNTIVFLGDAKTTKRSRATWVTVVENIPGFFDKNRPITKTTTEVLKFIQANEDLAPFVTSERQMVTKISKQEDHFVLEASSGDTFEAKYVVLCTGVMDVQPDIGGSIEPILPFANREDVLYCIRCDGHKTVGHNCAVIGPQHSAGWIAIMLHERYQLPNLCVLTHDREDAPDARVQELLDAYQIPTYPGLITEVLGDNKEGLKGFKLGDQQIDVTRAFVALGSIVYNDLAKQLGVEINDRDHLVTDAHGQTSVDGFYAAGDLVAGKKKQVYTSWDMAVDAVDHIDGRIRQAKRPV